MKLQTRTTLTLLLLTLVLGIAACAPALETETESATDARDEQLRILSRLPSKFVRGLCLFPGLWIVRAVAACELPAILARCNRVWARWFVLLPV